MYHEILSGESQSSPSLLTSEQDSSNKWELSFIDAGLVSSLSQEDRRNFVDLFAAVVQNDGKKVGQLMVDRSRDGGLKCLNREMFAVEIGELVNEVHSSGAAQRMTLHRSH
jgi:aarF domain-containing kinase